MLADRLGVVDGEPVRRHHPPRRADGAGPGGRDDPAGHRLRAVPLGRRQPAHQRRARPVQPDAGVQGLRRGGDAAGMTTVVVVGYGMAATRLVGGAASPADARRADHRPRRRAAPAVQPDPAVRRARGHAPRRTSLTLARVVRRHGVDLRLGTRVVEIDRGRPRGRCSPTARGSPYDPWCWPPAASRRSRRSAAWSGSTAGCTSGCTRSAAWTTASGSTARCRRARRAVVVGGGLLGLQVARALGVRGLAVEVVEGGDHLLRSQVDAAGRRGPGRAT